MQGDGGQLDRYCIFLDHMEKLRNSTNWDGVKNIKKESPAYTAMANYELAKSLSKVLHLSQMANQYVLTPNGFMPFVSRILELYEKITSNGIDVPIDITRPLANFDTVSTILIPTKLSVLSSLQGGL